MGRTKYEIDALTNAIYSKITEEQNKRVKAVRKEANEIFSKEYKPLLKEIEKAQSRVKSLKNKIAKKLYADPSVYVPDRENQVKNAISQKLAKIKDIDKDLIEQEVILSADQGADILIKNITKMFV